MKYILSIALLFLVSCTSSPYNKAECRPLEYAGKWKKLKLSEIEAASYIQSINSGEEPKIKTDRISWYINEQEEVVACEIHDYATPRFYSESPRGCSTTQYLLKKSNSGKYIREKHIELICVG